MQDLAAEVRSLADAARTTSDHARLVESLEHLQPRIDDALDARDDDEGVAAAFRADLVALCCRLGAASRANMPRGADVVALVGPARAATALVASRSWPAVRSCGPASPA